MGEKWQYMWGRKHKSAVDFVLVNRKIHRRIQRMEIDEDKEIIDYRDHSLITVVLRMEQNIKECKKGEMESISTMIRKES